MIMDRDIQFIRWIEQFKFATFEHLQNVFVKDKKCSYDIVRRRMNKITKEYDGYIKSFTFMPTNQKIFYINTEDPNKFTLHKLRTLDYVVQLYTHEVTIEHLEFEKQWCDGDIRSDMFCIYTFNNRMYADLVEVNITHASNLKRYDTLNNSMEIQNTYRIDFPRIILIDDVRHNKNYFPQSSQIKTIQLNTHLNEFGKLLQ